MLIAGVILNSTVATAQTKVSDKARAEAASIFNDRCAVCHGDKGDGKGPAADSLDPKPINFRDRKWQSSVTNEKIAQVIVYGGPAAGLSASMSANPDLKTRPEVVAALVQRIRGLAPRPH
ncbi:MAG TPA: c-type cytochrome [Candidatus Binataceae bacterium]|nr:c-type cytochrome [Candidatus Binataceae bacterium]